jgi:hypothetical protein
VVPQLLVASGRLGTSRETDAAERDRDQHWQEPSHLAPFPEEI